MGTKLAELAAVQDIDRLSINTIRTLSMDAVERANSGHPGAPMALAPVAYCLWQRFLRFDPEDPIWPDRDRFVLSNGHASMLLYSLLYLAGVKAVSPEYETLDELAVRLEDIQRFRELDSRCPGHPEYRWTSGVETSTGPLGQGVGASVGMAIAGRWMAQHFNRPGFDMFTYSVYVTCGDGDLMEGVGSEAASLAGHLKLGNLCWIYDNNRITLSGPASWAFTEDVPTRFMGYGWNVTRVGDANDLELIDRELKVFRNTSDRPTLIIADTHIGYGSPHKQDTKDAHGEPLGAEEVKLTKRFYGWPEEAQFLVPAGVRENFQAGIGKRGHQLREAWMARLREYERQYPELADEMNRIQRRELPDGWDQGLPTFPPDPKGIATRDSSSKVLNVVAENIPWMIGGDADLAPSTKTRLAFEGAGDFQPRSYGGRNIHFGVREHAMAAIANGLSLSKLRPFVGTFFVFSDYAKPAIRLSALMELPVIYIFTHDSISLGQDGPSHQPIEQLAALRAVPGLLVIRPADANEVTEAWKVIVKLRHEPVALVLTRQAVPTLDRTKYGAASGLAQGAYVLADPTDGKPDVLLIATGSEVALCLQACEALKADGIQARVVSMPSWELFNRQSRSYQESVIPPRVKARVCVEEAAAFGWERFAGRSGEIIAMSTFGASAPAKDVQKKFGFLPERIAAAARDQIANNKRIGRKGA